MSVQIVPIVNDTKDTDSGFMQSYQSLWMSRWKRTSCYSTTKGHDGSSNTFRITELDCAMGDADKMKPSRSVTGHEEIVTGTFEITKESLGMNSESLRKQGMKGKHEYQHNHEVGSHSRPGNSVTVCFRESNTSSLVDPPSISSHHLSPLDKNWLQKMQMFSGFRLFASLFNASGETELKKSLYDNYSLQKVPKCTHDVKTVRICSTVDSVPDTAGCCPNFYQATHRLLITKKTDVNLGNNIFRSTRILGDTPCDFCNLSPPYGQGKQELKIQSLSNFTNSEGKGKYVKDSEVTTNNESSVDEKDPLSGAISTPSMKAINVDCSSPNRNYVASSAKQAEVKRPYTVLPDMNLELHPLPATVTSSENGDPISSRTQRLEMDKRLLHAKQPKRPSPCPDNSPVANPGNICVKRKKLSSSNSPAQGTNSSSKNRTSFHEKLNKNLGTICRSAIISSEPTPRKPRGKDQYFSEKASKKERELLLSHAWIQRWKCNGSSSTKNESSTVVFSDPRSSNLTLKELQNDQFPSIAAMALMGRALSGFQPCELQRRGSFTVWNSRTL